MCQIWLKKKQKNHVAKEIIMGNKKMASRLPDVGMEVCECGIDVKAEKRRIKECKKAIEELVWLRDISLINYDVASMSIGEAYIRIQRGKQAIREHKIREKAKKGK